MHIRVYRARCQKCKTELLPSGKGKRKCKCSSWALSRGGNWKIKGTLDARNGENSESED